MKGRDKKTRTALNARQERVVKAVVASMASLVDIGEGYGFTVETVIEWGVDESEALSLTMDAWEDWSASRKKDGRMASCRAGARIRCGIGYRTSEGSEDCVNDAPLLPKMVDAIVARYTSYLGNPA
jgi:hypothetical protein